MDVTKELLNDFISTGNRLSLYNALTSGARTGYEMGLEQALPDGGSILFDKIFLLDLTAKAMPVGHPRDVVYTHNLGVLKWLAALHGVVEEPPSIVGSGTLSVSSDVAGTCLSLLESALHRTAADHPGYPDMLFNQTAMLKAVYESEQNLTTLNQAALVGGRMVSTAPPTHPNRPKFLLLSGGVLCQLFVETGNVDTLSEAVARYKEAVSLITDPGMRSRPRIRLSEILWKLFEMTDDIEDISMAISQTLDTMDDIEHDDQFAQYLTQPNLLMMMCKENLYKFTSVKAETTGASEDLSNAIESGKELLELLREGASRGVQLERELTVLASLLDRSSSNNGKLGGVRIADTKGNEESSVESTQLLEGLSISGSEPTLQQLSQNSKKETEGAMVSELEVLTRDIVEARAQASYISEASARASSARPVTAEVLLREALEDAQRDLAENNPGFSWTNVPLNGPSSYTDWKSEEGQALVDHLGLRPSQDVVPFPLRLSTLRYQPVEEVNEGMRSNQMTINALLRYRHQYRPIDTAKGAGIRIFKLLPGKPEDPIHGELIDASLDDKPKYEALSYSWGNPDIVSLIHLGEYSNFLNGTTNLFSALVRLRRRDVPRMLWVDAICINQRDDVEKTRQLTLMTRIYKEAVRVVVWLGPGFWNMGHGLAKLKELLQYGRDDKLGNTQEISQRVSDFDSEEEKSMDWYHMPSRSAFRIGLSRALSRDWWNRLWVVQEIALSREAVLYCGNRRISWPATGEISKVVQKMGTEGEILNSSSGPNAVDNAKEYLRSLLILQQNYLMGTRPHLLELLELFKNRLCTDPRDRIFSLLALADESDAAFNKADYSMSISAVQHRFFELCIARMNNLDIISCFIGPSQSDIHAPWAPFWDPRSQAVPIPYLGFRSIGRAGAPFRIFNATKDTVPDFEFTTAQDGVRTMDLRGLFVDSIAFVCEDIKVPENRRESRPAYATRFDWDLYARPTVRQWRARSVGYALKHDQGSTLPYGDSQSAAEQAFCLTLLADSDPRPNRDGQKPDIKASQAGMDSYLDYVLPFEREFGKLPTPDVVAEMKDMDYGEYAMDRQEPETCDFFNLGLRRAAFYRRFFVTRMGYFGLAPQSVDVGDQICLLLGGRTPFVIRATGDNRYRLLGECYTHGLMDGQAMDGLDGGCTLERISIF
jgi:hypothetical protein